MTATAILTIDGAGLRALARQLEEVDGDKHAALEAIGEGWETTTKERFATGTAPDGTPWKPSRRALKRGGKGTLVLSGDLRDSVTHDVVSDDTVEVGTNKLYAAAHQFGATIEPKAPGGVLRFKGADGGWVSARRVVLPARPFIGWNADDEANAAEILEGFVARKTGAAV